MRLEPGKTANVTLAFCTEFCLYEVYRIWELSLYGSCMQGGFTGARIWLLKQASIQNGSTIQV